jgi:two-component system, cell cycle response regulator
LLNSSARREPPLMRALLCAALIGFCAHALHAIGRLGGSSIGWLLESLGYTSLLVIALILMFRENRSLQAGNRSEARTDPLTGLANRRQLMEDLAQVTEAGSDPRVFALFDLDGFKAYNDSFGHPAGDSLLTELAERLQTAVAPDGCAYRLGGDEFCIVAPRTHHARDPIGTASAALCAHGEGFTIGSSCGVVFLPQEAGDPGAALRLTDRRMYAAKSRRPRSAERQMRNVLLRVLREREPELDRHLRSVAQLSIELGHTIHLNAEQLDEVARAAELHDIGKIAVPDAILHKQGPLNAGQWQIMRNHPLIGERILSSAPAMTPVAKLVRATHERWDGGGYPDGLAEEKIPLGSRLIAVCDAFVAMTEPRPWRTPLSFEEAASELQRCAGMQFDPALVASFCAFVYPDLQLGAETRATAEIPAADRANPADAHTKMHTETSDIQAHSDALNLREDAKPDVSD